MDMSGFTGSNYITADYLKSLGPNVRIEAKIVSVAVREFEIGARRSIYTDYQGKGVVLNPTRAKVLYAAFGPETITGSARRSSSSSARRRTRARRSAASPSRR